MSSVWLFYMYIITQFPNHHDISSVISLWSRSPTPQRLQDKSLKITILTTKLWKYWHLVFVFTWNILLFANHLFLLHRQSFGELLRKGWHFGAKDQRRKMARDLPRSYYIDCIRNGFPDSHLMKPVTGNYILKICDSGRIMNIRALLTEGFVCNLLTLIILLCPCCAQVAHAHFIWSIFLRVSPKLYRSRFNLSLR